MYLRYTTRRKDGKVHRYWLATAGTAAAASIERIDEPAALVTEFLMNALRLVEGVDSRLLTERTGQDAERIGASLDAATRRDWLATDPSRLQTTAAGLQSLNPVLALL